MFKADIQHILLKGLGPVPMKFGERRKKNRNIWVTKNRLKSCQHCGVGVCYWDYSAVFRQRHIFSCFGTSVLQHIGFKMKHWLGFMIFFFFLRHSPSKSSAWWWWCKHLQFQAESWPSNCTVTVSFKIQYVGVQSHCPNTQGVHNMQVRS